MNAGRDSDRKHTERDWFVYRQRKYNEICGGGGGAGCLIYTKSSLSSHTHTHTKQTHCWFSVNPNTLFWERGRVRECVYSYASLWLNIYYSCWICDLFWHLLIVSVFFSLGSAWVVSASKLFIDLLPIIFNVLQTHTQTHTLYILGVVGSNASRINNSMVKFIIYPSAVKKEIIQTTDNKSSKICKIKQYSPLTLNFMYCL